MQEKNKNLFRGQVKYNGNHLFAGEWVEGSLILKTKGAFIYVIEKDDFGNVVREFETEVLPETVGQFTGLTDKNGVKVFEGDRVRSPHGIEYTIVFIDENVQDIGDEIHSAFHASRINNTGNCISIPIDSYLKNNMEVIGNIHEGGNNE